jgi:hypothetical protein
MPARLAAFAAVAAAAAADMQWVAPAGMCWGACGPFGSWFFSV